MEKTTESYDHFSPFILACDRQVVSPAAKSQSSIVEPDKSNSV